MLDLMREWARILIITAAAGCAAGFIMPDSENGLGKYVRFACGVAAACVMAAPVSGVIGYLVSLAGNPPDTGIYDGSAAGYPEDEIREWIYEKTASDLGRGISEAVYDKFGVRPAEVAVAMSSPEGAPDKLNVDGIAVYINAGDFSGETGPAEGEIRDYLRGLLNFEPEIIIIAEAAE